MKNLLLSISMLAIVASASAQLYVGPVDTMGTPTDKEDDIPTFIYANKQVVFVTQDVQLEENPEGIYNASFYLRNKSQLLQGNAGSNNSGSGFLSVTQDSHSDSYDYNMWASPVSNQYFGSATAAIAGNRNYGIRSAVADSLDLTNARVSQLHAGWNGRGSGMGAAQQMVISNRWAYKYENDASGYSRIYGGDGVAPGYGFIMKGTNVTSHANMFIDDNNQRYDFRGRPNNGTITIPVGANDNIMSGNPYPSALDLQAFVVDNNTPMGKINSLLFWEENRTINSHYYRDNLGGYDTCTYNSGGFACTRAALMSYDNGGNPIASAGTGEILNRRHAAMGQGYFIVTEPGASGSITYENAQRVLVLENEDEASGDNIFRRPGSNDISTVADADNSPTQEFSRNNGVGTMRFHTFFEGSQTFYRDMTSI